MTLSNPLSLSLKKCPQIVTPPVTTNRYHTSIVFNSPHPTHPALSVLRKSKDFSWQRGEQTFIWKGCISPCPNRTSTSGATKSRDPEAQGQEGSLEHLLQGSYCTSEETETQRGQEISLPSYTGFLWYQIQFQIWSGLGARGWGARVGEDSQWVRGDQGWALGFHPVATPLFGASRCKITKVTQGRAAQSWVYF